MGGDAPQDSRGLRRDIPGGMELPWFRLLHSDSIIALVCGNCRFRER